MLTYALEALHTKIIQFIIFISIWLEQNRLKSLPSISCKHFLKIYSFVTANWNYCYLLGKKLLYMISHIFYFIGFCFPEAFSVSQSESAVKLLNRKSYKAPFSFLSLCLLDSFPHVLVPSTREERRREELRRHAFIKILTHPCFKVCCIPDITVFMTFLFLRLLLIKIK